MTAAVHVWWATPDFLARLRGLLPPSLKLSITALPAWLDSPELPALLEAVDSSVLQVHAVSNPRLGLFNPRQARDWAARWGQVSDKPFYLALPYGVALLSDDQGGPVVESEVTLLPASPARVSPLAANVRSAGRAVPGSLKERGMSTCNWPLHLLCLSLSLPLPALACGPDFPLRLLDDRAQSLGDLPQTNFAFEVSRFGQAVTGLKPATEATLTPYGYSDDRNKPYREQREKVEASELPENLRAEMTRLRGLQDPQQVETQGASLPAELRLYIAGAVAFQAGDAQRAAEYFRQVLALPADQRKLRSTWAAYSLGRALVALSVEPGRWVFRCAGGGAAAAVQGIAGQCRRQPGQRRSPGRPELSAGRLRASQGVCRTGWRRRPGMVGAGQAGAARQ